MDLQFRFNPRQTQIENLGWWYAEGRIASRTSFISKIQDTISPFRNEQLQKNANLVLQSWSNPASRKLMRRNSRVPRIQCITQKKSVLFGKESGMKFLLVNPLMEILFNLESRNWSCEYGIRKRTWLRYSLEFCKSKIAESISEGQRAKIHGNGMASTHLWRK